MITMQQIREAYPNPKAMCDLSDELARHAYCVGGAFQLYFQGNNADENSHFPSYGALALSLVQVNPNLDNDKAYGFARDIVTYNEKLCFENAWNTLNNALQFGQ